MLKQRNYFRCFKLEHDNPENLKAIFLCINIHEKFADVRKHFQQFIKKVNA